MVFAVGRFSHVPDGVHEQRLVVRVALPRGMPLDRRVQVPRVDHVVGEDVLAVVVQVQLDLLEHLLGDLLRRALLRRLAVDDPGRVPVGDVDREAVELACRRRSRCGKSRSAQNCACVSAVSAHGASMNVRWPRMTWNGLLQVVLDAVHPVDVELVHELERLVGAQHGGRPQLARALGRHRADEPVGLDRAPAAAPVARPGAHRPCRPPCGAPRRPGRRGSARRGSRSSFTHGSIQASFVGRFSTRSGAPSLPRPLDVVDERLAHVPDRARARLALLRGDDRARQAARQDLLVLVRLALGLDEVPPADVLPLRRSGARRSR